MKTTTITAAIAFAILLITGTLFRVFAPEHCDVGGREGTSSAVSSLFEDADSADHEPGPAETEAASRAAMKLQELKKKMSDDGADFGAMMKRLQERLNSSPDGKISEKDILGVIPPEHAEEFKKIINEMYYPGTINDKENQQ